MSPGDVARAAPHARGCLLVGPWDVRAQRVQAPENAEETLRSMQGSCRLTKCPCSRADLEPGKAVLFPSPD